MVVDFPAPVIPSTITTSLSFTYSSAYFVASIRDFNIFILRGYTCLESSLILVKSSSFFLPARLNLQFLTKACAVGLLSQLSSILSAGSIWSNKG